VWPIPDPATGVTFVSAGTMAELLLVMGLINGYLEAQIAKCAQAADAPR
jgi:hypothetical protein